MDITQEIRRRILTGRYAPGERIPPERELEEEFDCSRLTVAKAMAPLVSDGLIKRYRGRGSFVVERENWLKHGATPEAQRRASRRGNVVKYISPGHERGVGGTRDDVLAGLHRVLDGGGYHVSVDFYSDLEQHLHCLAKVEDPQIGGLVLWPLPDPRTVAAVSKIAELGVPLVLIDSHLPEVDCDYVVTDNTEGAATIVRYLADLGHRRICYLTRAIDRTSLRDRLTGFLRGMVEARLPVDSQSVVHLADAEHPGEVNLQGVVGQLLQQPVPPTALFASHDALALSIYPLLQARGIRVPEDITLVGYDGIEAGEFCAIPLTTMRQDFGQMASVAARILLERVGGRPELLHYHWMVKPQLVARASSAAPSAAVAGRASE